jgi:hypothetical protein
MKKFVLLALFTCLSGVVHAGQGLIISKNGDPLTWNKSAAAPLNLHVESGECGQFTNAEMLTRLATNLGRWTSSGYVDMGFTIVTGTIAGVDTCNYGDYLAGVIGSSDNSALISDSINPVLFDNDGELIETATGETNGRLFILGFANPAGFLTDSTDTDLLVEIVDGQAVFNCYCLEAADGGFNNTDCETNSTKFLTADLDFTMVHEIGHMLNLDHDPINSALDSSFLPTMFPSAQDSAEQLSPNETDTTAMASLYPSSTFYTQGDTSSDYCFVDATILDRFGEEMRCADINFIHDTDDSLNVSFISGAYGVNTDANSDGDTQDSGECTSGCGGVEAYLSPGSTYGMRSAKISSSFTGGSGVSPCSSSQLSLCTAANIVLCDSSDTSCSACVANEALTTSTNGDIATLISSQCTAGAVVNLGSITTSSVSQTTAASLLTTAIDEDDSDVWVPDAMYLSDLVSEGDSEAQYQTSCPESGGATTTTSSSSGGCSLNTGQSTLPNHYSLWWFIGGLIALCLKFLCTNKTRKS